MNKDTGLATLVGTAVRACTALQEWCSAWGRSRNAQKPAFPFLFPPLPPPPIPPPRAED